MSASVGCVGQEVYKIYDGPAPGSENWTDPELSIPAPWSSNPLIFNVTEPTITVYRPDKAIDTGAAMIIAPGGANIFLTWKEEGTNVAEWFQRHGVTGILLKYRTIQSGSREKIDETLKAISDLCPPCQQSAQSEVPASSEVKSTLQGDDGRQAMKYVRQHAAELGINPDKVGIMGFSAGALLTSNVIYLHDEQEPSQPCGIHLRQRRNEYNTRSYAAVHMFTCQRWQSGGRLFAMHQNWKAAGVPSGIQFIYDARHGDGLQYNGKEWNEWIDNLYNFMKAVNFIEK